MKITVNQEIIKKQHELMHCYTADDITDLCEVLRKELRAFTYLVTNIDGNAYVNSQTAIAYLLGREQGLFEAKNNVEV